MAKMQDYKGQMGPQGKAVFASEEYCNYSTAIPFFMFASGFSYILIITGMSDSANSAIVVCIHNVYASSSIRNSTIKYSSLDLHNF